MTFDENRKRRSQPNLEPLEFAVTIIVVILFVLALLAHGYDFVMAWRSRRSKKKSIANTSKAAEGSRHSAG